MGSTRTTSPTPPVNASPPLVAGLTGGIAGGVLLGMSLAAFFDGIVLHQLLQWHHMLSSVESPHTIAGLEANVFWDGVFLLGAVAFTIVGLSLLWRSQQENILNLKALTGALLLGVGSFNMVEGLIDHHLLGIHHVKSGANQSAWDIGFLIVSAILVVIGWLILRSQRPTSAASKNG